MTALVVGIGFSTFGIGAELIALVFILRTRRSDDIAGLTFAAMLGCLIAFIGATLIIG